MSQFRKVHRILAFLSFLITFATYYLTGYPSISFGESGALAAAAFHQQVPAGPGAPLWIVVAGAFAKLLPGDPAYVLTLFSALCGAFTAMMVYLIVVALWNSPSVPLFGKEGEERKEEEEENGEDKSDSPSLSNGGSLEGISWREVPALVGGLIAALSFAWFDAQWSDSTQITTRSAGTLIVALVLWLGIQWYRADREGEAGSARWLLLAAYVAGLALGVDRLALGVIPGVGMIVWMRRFVPQGESGRYVLGALLGMVGVLLLWYAMAASAFPLLLLLAFLVAVGGMFVPKGREAGIACAFLIVFVALGYSLYTQVGIRSAAHPGMNMMEQESGVLSYMNAPSVAPGSEEMHPLSLPQPNRRRAGQFSVRYLLWNAVGRASDVHDAPAAWFAVSDETREKYIVPTGRDDLFPVRFFALPLLLALAGLVIHFRSDWRSGIALATLFLSLGPLGTILWNVGSSHSGEGDGHFASALLIIAIWIGIGAAGLARAARAWGLKQEDESNRGRGENLASGVLVLCFALVPLNLLYNGLKTHNHYEDQLPHDFAWNLLQSCDSNAILFTEDASPLRYVQDVTGVRRDVRVVDLSLAGEEWYGNQIKEEPMWDADAIPMQANEEKGFESYASDSLEVVRLPVSDAEGVADSILWYREGRMDDSGRTVYDPPLQLIRSIVEANEWKRPIYFAMTVHPSLWGGLEKFFRWEGLAFRLVPGNDVKGIDGYTEFPIDVRRMNDLISKDFRLRDLTSSDIAFTESERRIVPFYRRLFIGLAADALKNTSEPGKAATFLDAMDRRISTDAFPLSYWDAAAVASLYHEAGNKRGTEKYARHAIERIERIGGGWRDDPIARRFNPYQTSARMYALLGDFDRAIQSYKETGRDWAASPVLRGLVEELRIERHFVKGDTAAGVAELRRIIGEYGSPTDPGMQNNLDAWKEMLEELE